jgi:hypothetical protein
LLNTERREWEKRRAQKRKKKIKLDQRVHKLQYLSFFSRLQEKKKWSSYRVEVDEVDERDDLDEPDVRELESEHGSSNEPSVLTVKVDGALNAAVRGGVASGIVKFANTA